MDTCRMEELAHSFGRVVGGGRRERGWLGLTQSVACFYNLHRAREGYIYELRTVKLSEMGFFVSLCCIETHRVTPIYL